MVCGGGWALVMLARFGLSPPFPSGSTGMEMHFCNASEDIRFTRKEAHVKLVCVCWLSTGELKFCQF